MYYKISILIISLIIVRGAYAGLSTDRFHVQIIDGVSNITLRTQSKYSTSTVKKFLPVNAINAGVKIQDLPLAITVGYRSSYEANQIAAPYLTNNAKNTVSTGLQFIQHRLGLRRFITTSRPNLIFYVGAGVANYNIISKIVSVKNTEYSHLSQVGIYTEGAVLIEFADRFHAGIILDYGYANITDDSGSNTHLHDISTSIAMGLSF